MRRGAAECPRGPSGAGLECGSGELSQYRFRDFPTAIRFVDEMARIAELEQHHPVFKVDLDKVDVENWTHAVGGLSESV
jgi:pterin-4a-carbinolamine dehydratase